MSKHNSSLETLSDKILFIILKEIHKCFADEYGFISFDISVNEYFVPECIESSMIKMGILSNNEIEIVDIDFIVHLYKLNGDLLKSDKLTGSINRPKQSKYSYEYFVSERKIVNSRWRHTVFTYGEKEGAIQLVNKMDESYGSDYWQGQEVGTDTEHSEVEDEYVDLQSFKKLK
jgi:hypothetical protein